LAAGLGFSWAFAAMDNARRQGAAANACRTGYRDGLL